METMELLKKARKQAGMTQKEFSEYFGIPCRTIEDWERGARHMANYLLRLMIYRLEAVSYTHLTLPTTSRV